MTHFATADGDQEFVAAQLERFTPFVEELRQRAPGIVAHAANSAATLRTPASHLDMVRCGIALYGCDPMNEDPDAHGLEPALELSSYVAAVKRARAGRQRGLRPPVHHPARHVARDTADRLRRRDPPGSRQQLRRADRRAPVPAGGHGPHGQRHRRPRPRRVRGGDRRPGGRDRARRIGASDGGGSGATDRHDQLRDRVRDLASCPACLPPRRRPGRAVRAAGPLDSLGGLAGDGWLVGGAVRDGLLGRPTTDFDVALAGDARTDRAYAGALARCPSVQTLRGVRGLEVGRPRPQLAGRRAAAWRGDDRDRPRPARPDDQRDGRAPGRRPARRPVRRGGGSPRRGACGWCPRGRSKRIRCGCSDSPGSPANWGLRPRRDDLGSRG